VTQREEREEHEARESEAAAAERRRRRLWQLGATVVVAGALVALAIAIAGAGDDNPGTVTGPPQGVAETNALFRGIPQRGIEVGSANAPLVLAEFADIQCPFCGKFARETLPEVVRRYVRTGRVRVAWRGLAFIGKDSDRGARMAAAAGLQGKLWQFVELLYRNQGSENDGWVTDDYLRRIGEAVGLDVDRAFEDRNSPAVDRQLEEAKTAAKAAGVDRTPGFTVSRAGGEPKKLDVDFSSVDEFTRALDDALAGG
jgi:protein-disulfide isomerase